MRSPGGQDASYLGTFVAQDFDNDSTRKCVQFNSKNDEHLKAAFPNLFKHKTEFETCPERKYTVQINNASDMKWGSWFVKK